MNILNISSYQFVELTDLENRRVHLREQGEKLDLKGTIILSPEGINLMLAGTPESLEKMEGIIKEDPIFSELTFKQSWSETVPFRRFLVKVKSRLIPIRLQQSPREKTGKYLAPEQLKQWLDEQKDFCFIDTRNDYEIEFGKFARAIDFNLEHFAHFPEHIQNLPKDKPIVMYCTGGIRCEKGSALLLEHGFENVYQLEGGILKYFEQCGGAHYTGFCFVFDQRVAVKPDLKPI